MLASTPASLAELQRILRTRLAELKVELEAERALTAKISPKFTPPLSLAELQLLQEESAKVPLHKLD
jgi:hypothetical protein